MRKKGIIGLSLALLLFIQVLCFLQLLVTPKYMEESRDGAMIGEYYDQAGYQDLIFLGDCEVYENFSPVVLWEEYGISSWIRGSAQQTIWQSCCLMEETFRYETPRVMVFNVLSMKYSTPQSTADPLRREAYNRMTLDTMRWSSCKWRCIRASMTEQERQQGAMWTYLFPILRYHERWSQLTQEDIRYLFHRDPVTDNGYLMQTGVAPFTQPHEEPPPVEEDFGEESWAYLDRMRLLCEENGTRLVLIKAPSLYPRWWDCWDERIRDYARRYELPYYNLLEAQEAIGLDWSADTYDTGLHLNVWGAEKLSRYFGRLLQQDLALPDRRDDPALSAVWEEKLRIYDRRKSGDAVPVRKENPN